MLMKDKIKLLKDSDKLICYLDIETTGLNKVNSDITIIGIYYRCIKRG